MTLIKRGREVAVTEQVTEVWTCSGTERKVDLKMEESRRGRRGWKNGLNYDKKQTTAGTGGSNLAFFWGFSLPPHCQRSRREKTSV